MKTDNAFVIFFAYFLVAFVILLSASVFPPSDESIGSIPILLSVLLLIPLYSWQRRHSQKTEVSKNTTERSRYTTLSWIFALLLLAFSVRIPSVLLFGVPLEKTPLIYLVVLTVLLIERTDLTVFGFKTRRIWKSLLYGFVFFALLDGLSMFLNYFLISSFINQSIVQSYDITPFLLTMPFMTLCVGISEEGFFRGYAQTHLQRFYSPAKAVLIQAALFGAWHFVWNLSPFDPAGMSLYVTETFFIGLIFGYFYYKTRNLTPLIFAHGLWDSVPQGIIFNESALSALEGVSVSSQVLVWVLPYVVAAALTLLFIKYLAKEI